MTNAKTTLRIGSHVADIAEMKTLVSYIYIYASAWHLSTVLLSSSLSIVLRMIEM